MRCKLLRYAEVGVEAQEREVTNLICAFQDSNPHNRLVSKLGSTVIGVQTAEGVVIAAEKRMTSKLMEKAADKVCSRLCRLGWCTSEAQSGSIVS